MSDKKLKNEVGLLVGFFLFVLFLRTRPYIHDEEVNRNFAEGLGLGLMRAAWWGLVAGLLHTLFNNCLLRGME